jgi:hypothetical protein
MPRIVRFDTLSENHATRNAESQGGGQPNFPHFANIEPVNAAFRDIVAANEPASGFPRTVIRRHAAPSGRNSLR